jgi:hypothetical protein
METHDALKKWGNYWKAQLTLIYQNL